MAILDQGFHEREQGFTKTCDIMEFVPITVEQKWHQSIIPEGYLFTSSYVDTP